MKEFCPGPASKDRLILNGSRYLVSRGKGTGDFALFSLSRLGTLADEFVSEDFARSFDEFL